MTYPIYSLSPREFPTSGLGLLTEIPQPPKSLYYRGVLPPSEITLLTVVGSRKYSTYGKQVIDHLIGGLRGYPVGIVSGLALGTDSLAHEAALANNLYTMAVPGSGIQDDTLYPRTNHGLAKRILERDGCLLSEFPPETKAALWTFPQRNRIMAGLAPATLIIEASEKSGTLITARMATDYNRELLVVPGNIFSKNTVGPHQFLKLGATPVTSAVDILYALGIDPENNTKSSQANIYKDLSPEELLVIELLVEPTEKDELIRKLNLPAPVLNVLLMQMEIKGLIAQERNQYRAVI